jgi:uncharacterized protein (DUF983 family)
VTRQAAAVPRPEHPPLPATRPPRPTDRGLHQARLLLIDAATVAVGTAVGLLLRVNPWLAVPVGLIACLALHLAALRVLHGLLHGRRHRETR